MNLQPFIDTHLGVGFIDSPVWYIGPEPAGTGTREDLELRVQSFELSGSRAITNLHIELLTTGEHKWMTGPKPPTQPYWRRIAHLDLMIRHPEYDDVTIDQIRMYQKNVMCALAQRGPLMLETSALPAKNDKHWEYSNWSDLPELQTRKKYFEITMPKRIALIRQMIENYRPPLVLLCGPTYYQDRWSKLLGCKFHGTHIQMIPHPCAKGVEHSVWTNLGKQLREHL